MALLCNGCDAPRETIRAFCHDCGEVTESYDFRDDGNDDYIASRALDLIAEDMHRLRFNTARRLDEIAAARKAAMLGAAVIAAALVAAPAQAWCPGVKVNGLCRTDSAVDFLRDPDFDLTRNERLLDFDQANASRPVRAMTRWRGGLPAASSQPALILDQFRIQF